MNTRYTGNRWGNAARTIASLFIAVSLIVSGCSNALPPAVTTPNQTVPNTTPPEPVSVPNVTPNNPTTPPPAANTTTAPIPVPNITVNVTPPPPPIPVPNTTQNTTPPPDQTPAPNETANTTPNTTENTTTALISYKKVQTLFNMFCATSSCHDGTGNNTLILLPGVSYDMLVNVPSDFLKDKLRVKPGAPAQSVIMIMITDPEHCTVPQSVIDTIKQWILEGALNN